MLFDPFEKKFDLPAFPIEFRDRQGIKCSIVGYELVDYIGGKIFINNHSKSFRIVLCRSVSGKPDHLITYNPSFHVYGTRAYDIIPHIVFGKGDEKGPLPVDTVVQTVIIQIAPINHIDSSRLDIEFIQEVDIVDRSLGQTYEDREIAPEIQQGMHLDTAFVLPESSPRAEFQAQTDCTAVESVDKVFHVQSEAIILLVHWACDINQHLGKICIDAPVTKFIGFRKGISRNSMLYSTMVELTGDCIQAVLYIAKTVPLGKLGKAHHIEMVPASEISNPMVPIISGNTFIEFIFRHHGHKLCENCLPNIHGGNRYDFAIKVDFKSLKILALVNYLLLTYYILFPKFKRDTSDLR